MEHAPATPQKRTRVGESLAVMGEAVDLVEDLYQASHGEETPEIEAAERFAAMATAEALEQLARFSRWLEHGAAAIEMERKRLDEAAERIKSRQAWADAEILRILEREGKKSAAAGAFHVKTRAGRMRVEAEAGLDASELPEAVRAWKEPVPGRWTLDKRAALHELQHGLPIPGLRLVRGARSVKIE